MKRYECLQVLVPFINEEDIVVTNLGMIIPEWEHLNARKGNFYMWHSLGLATSIGLGMALALPRRRVWVMEGDGGLLLNLGSLATIGNFGPDNMKVIVFDNQIYEAPGGHPTATSRGVNLAGIAREAGIKYSKEVTVLNEFQETVDDVINNDCLCCIVAKTEPWVEKVPPMIMDAIENKYQLIRWIEQGEGITIIPRF